MEISEAGQVNLAGGYGARAGTTLEELYEQLTESQPETQEAVNTAETEEITGELRKRT
jgi:hypothetical protein